MRRRVNIIPKKSAGGATHNSQHLPGLPFSNEYSEPDLEFNSMVKEVPREEANVEVEKGETVKSQTEEGLPFLQKVGGKKHYDGGTPANLKPGDFVFSDDKTLSRNLKDFYELFGIKNSKKKQTFADISKKYEKSLNNASLTIKDPDADIISKQTAELTIANITYKLGQLALIQEAIKGFPNGVPSPALPYLEVNGINPEDIQDLGQVNELVSGDMMMAQDGIEVPDFDISVPLDPTRLNEANILYDDIKDPRKMLTGAAGFNWMASVIRDRKNQRQLRDLIHPDNMSVSKDATRGDWHTNTGDFRPDQKVPIQFKGSAPYTGMGSGYRFMEEGGERIEGEFYPEDGVFYRDGKLYDSYGNQAPEGIEMDEDISQYQDGGDYDPNKHSLTGKSGAIHYYQQRTGKPKNFYGKASLEGYEIFKQRNPWFDFTGFDPSNSDDIRRFQEEYNKLVKEGHQLKVDGKFGEQTESAHIPWVAPDGLSGDAPDVENTTNKVGDIEIDPNLDITGVNASTDQPWWTQDILNTSAALLNTLGIRKTLPWSPTMQLPEIPATFLDPERMVHSAESQVGKTQDMLAGYADPQSFSGRASEVTGTGMNATANILSQINNANVQIANNRDNVELQALMNAQNINNQAAQRLYDGTAISNQQYKNAKREANQVALMSFINGLTNAQKTAVDNELFGDRYKIDPSTGRVIWNGKDAKWGEPSPGDMASQMGSTFQRLKDEFPNIDDEILFKMIEKSYGGSGSSQRRVPEIPQAKKGGNLRRVRIK